MHHVHGALIDQLDVDAVVFERNVMAFAKGRFFDPFRCGFGAADFAKQLVYEFFDHEI